MSSSVGETIILHNFDCNFDFWIRISENIVEQNNSLAKNHNNNYTVQKKVDKILKCVKVSI